ncbi:N-alpha-acetyltransferase 80 [Engystomops pustulosus]|uniref:N-alpha-acetyltransferase 80 n=1 Tax=Engystomops pustulosus TaxID=76066 RepID=UPI003AFA2FE7
MCSDCLHVCTDRAAAAEHLALVPLHHRPDLTASCAELLNQTWKRSLGARLHSLQRSSDDFPVCLVLIGAPEGPALGHARLCRVLGFQDSLFVESVVVSTDLRGKGYGRKLMEATERYARGRGYRNLYLTTHDKQDFYHHLGYQLSEPVQNMGSLNGLLPPAMIQKMTAPISYQHPVSSPPGPPPPSSTSPPPPGSSSWCPPPPPPGSSSWSPPPPPPGSSSWSPPPPPPPPGSSSWSPPPPPPPPGSSSWSPPPPPPPPGSSSWSPPPPPPGSSSWCLLLPPGSSSLSPPPPPPPPGSSSWSPPPPPPPPGSSSLSPPGSSSLSPPGSSSLSPPVDVGRTSISLQTPYRDIRGGPIFWMKKCI